MHSGWRIKIPPYHPVPFFFQVEAYEFKNIFFVINNHHIFIRQALIPNFLNLKPRLTLYFFNKPEKILKAVNFIIRLHQIHHRFFVQHCLK